MPYIHQDLVSGYHWYQVAPVAGGRVTFTGTATAAVTGAWGGFAVSAADSKSNLTCTWSQDYSGTPLVLALAEYEHSSVSGSAFCVGVSGVAATSAAFKLFNSGGVNTDGAGHIFIWGSATGQVHN